MVLVFGSTWTIGLELAAQSRGLLPELVPPALGLLVGYLVVAGTVTATAIQGGRRAVVSLLRRFTVCRVSPAWYAVALLGFPVLYVVALAIAAVTSGSTPDFGSARVLRFVPAGLNLAIVAPAWFLYEVFTNGEEIAWRGYLLPRLQSRHAPLLAALMVGVVWAAWHFPKFLAVPSTFDYPLWLWTLDILSKAVIITWLFNSTRGSLLLATLFHASWNTAALCLPILPSTNGDLTAFTVAVCGTAVVAAGVVVRDPRLGMREPGRVAREGLAAVS